MNATVTAIKRGTTELRRWRFMAQTLQNDRKKREEKDKRELAIKKKVKTTIISVKCISLKQ